MSDYRAATSCARCSGAMPDGGHFTTDGELVCARCAAHATVATADARLAEERRAGERLQTAATIATAAAAGAGVWLVVLMVVGLVVIAVVVALLASFFRGCVVPGSMNVG